MKRSARTTSAPRVPPDLVSVMKAWRRQQAALSAETGRFFIDLDITTAQMRVLGQLRRWGRLSGRELASRLGVTPGTVVPLCDRLEELGYLKRTPDRDDRRLTWLELAPGGEELFRRLWMAGGERLMKAIGVLTPEDRRSLERLLTRLADYLEQSSTRAGERDMPPGRGGASKGSSSRDRST